MTEHKDPVPEQTTPTQQPTQSVEDAQARQAGIPKTPEELEAEREAMEKARLEQYQPATPPEARPSGSEAEPTPTIKTPPAQPETKPKS
jgi:hypothetical protein